MQTFSIKAGLVVIHNRRRMTLTNRLSDFRLHFKDEFGEPLILTEKEFYKAYELKELYPDPEQSYLGSIPVVRNAPPDLSCFPKHHSEEAVRRRSYLNYLLPEGRTVLPSSNDVLEDKIAEAAREIKNCQKLPSAPTVRRWFRTYYPSMCVVKLVPAHRNKGRVAIIRGELEEMLHDTLNEEYLKQPPPNISKLYKAFETRVKEANKLRLPKEKLALPSEMSIRRYLERLDPYQVDCARLGKYAADKKHRNAIGQLRVEMILDRWEIDHTLMDVLLVDPDTGEVIGRPYLTVVLDRASRMVMAFLIHLSAPNTESVLRVIERAIRPKQAWLEKHPKLQSRWRARGLPLVIVPDNAAEFHADDLVLAFNELGIEILFPKSRGPEQKGAVERFFRTLAQGIIHVLPGTTFSNSRQRGDYPSEKMACLTLPELEAIVAKWVVDIYHQTPHRGLKGKTPSQAWMEGENDRAPRLPCDLDALESILARRKSPRLHHYGVEVDGQQYHSSELAELRLRLDEKANVDVRYRDDLGHVWVRDPIRNVFIQVPNKDSRMVGLSRDLYKAAQERVKEGKGNPKDFEQTYEAYCEIMDDVDNARKSNKLRKRREVAKAKLDKEGNTRPVSEPFAKPKKSMRTPEFTPNPDVKPLVIRPRSF